MFESVTQSELRAQMEQHLLMVEEVLGGLDQFVQGLERRITRIEEGLGLEPDGLSVTGWVADLQRVKAELAALRRTGVDALDTSLSESFLDHFHPLLPLAAMALYEGHRLWLGRQSMDSFKLALARRSQRIVVTQTIGAAVYALDGLQHGRRDVAVR